MQAIHEINSSLEEERIKILKKYQILDTPPDGSFDILTKFAAQLLNMPIAIVSLVDTDRIWFKSKHGIDVQEIGRDPGLCSSAIMSDDLYLIKNAEIDPRSLANPLVAGEFGLRFYAAVPLKTREGYNLGTFCVIDKEPREFDDKQKEILETLADLAMFQMELRLEARTAVKHQHYILNTTAHDLKNPVAIMPLLADMIIHSKNNPAAIEDMAKQIKDAGKRMTKTIEDLLETAREETDEVPLRLKALDLAQLVKGVIASNAALAKKKKQQLFFESEEACMIFGDHRRLSEVVDNLLNNAIKYSPNFKNIEVVVKVKNNKAFIEIKDEGPGLSKDDMKNLFRQFTTLSAQPTGGESSSGLGLSIVKNLVEAHDGKISAISQGKDKGATFIVELPLSEQ